ncbi:PEP-CTERM sorting domain-containing protein [Leptolyngbya cf. ectocarpi LEGE 11479]|uniref:PEP-CTERM sorting domain-containing protein n=1 Tax=Leptolyngbya cf. ectocarpi LEGE 11479 TaxID=1828722 RepID=A0A929FAY5_LEPEC|nr:PEP-CTERM sorting domain-containing protein [Leptolyngbya ectocarpi]MBE9070311.1 PEP-CTERM sorting domain-containing protein [Leptolyngbya cf. ectocarpi LEGE 11479]
MKQILLAAAAALGVTAFAAPAHAARFKWTIDYTGFFADGAAINGFFIADETAATDGFVSGDEFDTWEWTWSGNSEVEAFTLTSSNAEAETFFGDFGFFVDGTANVPGDDASEGVYISDEAAIDLDFLFVDTFDSGAIASITGDTTAAGLVSVSDPEAVPEPATLLGLLTLAGAAAVAKRQKQAA